MPAVSAVDPFDLPEWLGVASVTWTASSSVRRGHHVAGELAGGGAVLECDLLGCDLAYPAPVLDEKWRHDAHQSWAYRQVLLVRYDGRLTLAVPGSSFTPGLAMEAIGRLAKAVGAKPARYTVTLRL